MYAKFFGLNQDPFSIAPDPRYLFMSERHREALAHLLYGLGGGGGFVLLSGEIGTGKTTVCRCFLEQIPANCNVAYIFNPKLSVIELLRSICDEFHIALPATATSAKDFTDPLNAFLLAGHAAGKNNVLIIDEAQNLSADVLEQLRLLTNLETNERKLLQIVLIGQPELRRMLARPELEQLAQRVIARFHLDALSVQETSHYIAHRLAVAGMTGASPFDGKALARIHKLSRGVPRRINLLCGRALLGAYASGKAVVDSRTVDKAALEVFGPKLGLDAAADQTPQMRHSTRTNMAVALASMAGLLVGAVLLGLFLRSAPGEAMWASFQANPASSAKTTAAKAALPPASSELAGGTVTSTVTSPTSGSLTATIAATSVTAVASVPAVSVTTSAPIPLIDSKTGFANLINTTPVTQNAAWQTLGKAWNLAISNGDFCETAQQQRIYCYTNKQTSLSLIRELDRPGVLTLFDDNKRPVYAQLKGLGAQSATLGLGTQTFTVPLTLLADAWRGDFSTLRLAPEGYAENTANGKNKPSADWLAAQLAKLPGASPVSPAKTAAAAEAALRDQVYAFQLAHGLNPDGQAGSMTLMQLNRATGVAEPRLSSNKP